MIFRLHPNLQCKPSIIDLPLCKVLLEDNRSYPWVFLVPRRENISMIMDLEPGDQFQLLKEIDWTQKILWDIFKPAHLNVAAIGNKTPQLHIHVIARSSSDPAWPNTVWDHPVSDSYPIREREEIIHKLFEAYETFMQPVADADGEKDSVLTAMSETND